MIKKNEFNPKLREFFFSPSYLERKELYDNIENISKGFSGDILDLGCGAKPYQHLFDCDSYKGLEVNGGGGDADYFYDGFKFPFKNKEFDGVVSFQVIYQIPNLDDILKEMNRVLKENGKLLVSVPFIWFDGGSNMHRRFSQEYVKTKFKQFGFETIKVEQTNSNMSALCLLTSKYIEYKISKISFSPVRKILRLLEILLVTPFFNLIGSLFLKFMKKDNELYIDTILFAKKVKNV
jgi:SAM-dependent methyltransferase